ncbi:hypothetical protein HUU05_22845 [candidate division KSB1 bacterium]|nr:hypothetical protein [candidate division KSB1 bacterium]
MKCSKWFRQIAPMISLVGSLLAVSCSEEPTPGPMSPVNSNKSLVAEQSPNSTGEVRPLNRQTAVQSLAKTTTYDVKAVLHMQDLIDELQYIVTNKPGSAVADKIEDAVAKVVSAQSELKKSPPDNSAALGNLSGAMNELQAAMKDNLLNSTTGNQFINEVKAIKAILNTGGTIDHDCRGTTKYLWMKKSEGGLIALCGHQIVVPKSALKSDANMYIKIDNTSFITVDCGPDGTFNSPVSVNISYRDADMTGVNVNNLTTAWYDTATNKWTNLGGTVNLIAKIVQVLTNHFTQYTISTK